MEAGKLRHRVKVQEAVQSQDSYGDTTTVWSDVVTRWASIEPTGGKEITLGGRVVADATHRISIRWLDGVTPKHRILWGERVFDIEAVINPEEVGDELHLACKEVAS